MEMLRAKLYKILIVIFICDAFSFFFLSLLAVYFISVVLLIIVSTILFYGPEDFYSYKLLKRGAKALLFSAFAYPVFDISSTKIVLNVLCRSDKVGVHIYARAKSEVAAYYLSPIVIEDPKRIQVSQAIVGHDGERRHVRYPKRGMIQSMAGFPEIRYSVESSMDEEVGLLHIQRHTVFIKNIENGKNLAEFINFVKWGVPLDSEDFLGAGAIGYFKKRRLLS